MNKNLINRFLPLFLWCVLIFLLSSITAIKVTDEKILNLIWHKLAHLFEYTVLFILSFRAFGKHASKAFLFTLFYAFTDEIHQLFIPTREGRIRDVFIDLTGGLLGWLIVWKLQAFLPTRLKNWLLI